MRTEHTLKFFSDPIMRKKNRRGLLKGEQIHALIRDIKFGHQGKINEREWFMQKNSCSSLTLVLAAIIYWQAKEIHRVIKTEKMPDGVDLSMLAHISPVTWFNVILYGEYVLREDNVIL